MTGKPFIFQYQYEIQWRSYKGTLRPEARNILVPPLQQNFQNLN